MSLQTQEVNGKISQKEDACGAAELGGSRPSDGALFLTAFTIDFFRF